MARKKKIVGRDLVFETPTKEEREAFEEFWAPLVCDKTGRLVRDRVINELTDYRFMLQQVPKVYMEVTGGELSKPNYEAKTVIAVANDFQNRVWEETLDDEKEAWEAERDEETAELKQEIERLRERLQILEDSASGQIARVEEVCFVDLKNGPRENRVAIVTTSKGKYRVLWNMTYDVIVVEKDNPLPDEWIDTVLEAVKKLDKKES